MTEVYRPPLLEESRLGLASGHCTARAWSAFLIYAALAGTVSSIIVLWCNSPFLEFWKDNEGEGWTQWIPFVAQNAMYITAPIATLIIVEFLKTYHEDFAKEVASRGQVVCNCGGCGVQGAPQTPRRRRWSGEAITAADLPARVALECWEGPPPAEQLQRRVYASTGALILAYVVMDFIFLQGREDYALALLLSATAWGPCLMGFQHAVVLMRHTMRYKIAKLQSEWLALSHADCGSFQDFRAPYLRCWQEVQVLNQQWSQACNAFVLWLALWIVMKGGIAVTLAVIGQENFQGHEKVYLMLLVQLTVFSVFLFLVLFKVLQTNTTTDKLRDFIIMYLHPSGSMDLGLLYRLIDDKDLMLKVLGVRLNYSVVVSALVTVAGSAVGSLLKFASDLHAANQQS